MRSLIDDVHLINLPELSEENGQIIIVDGINNIPFTISRTFMIKGVEDSIRGQHAHRNCKQFLLCISGSIVVLCDDGNNAVKFKLDCSNIGLFVPPGIWAEQHYIESGSILVAFCDRPFEESDYIRDREEFLKFCNKNTK
jgi:dTDP-4-dehydrorhamnose 3,5-epimerase-like enzyme